MEGFEHLVKVALENEKMIVSSNVKFHVARDTRKKGRPERQSHGYEIDLVGARQDLLVLASVKSFFGSLGVSRQGFKGLALCDTPSARQESFFSRYKIFNDADLRSRIIAEAANRYGYQTQQVELRLYVGKFRNADDKAAITDHLGKMKAGKGPIRVIPLENILGSVFQVLDSRTYVNDPVISTLKALAEAARIADAAQSGRSNANRAIENLSRVLGIDRAQVRSSSD